jgi:hypothetical protein
MNLFSRKLLIGVIALIVLNSSCNLPAQTPPASQQTSPPTLAGTPTPISLIPVTANDAFASLQCQFCVNDEIHAVLLIPQAATFLVSDPIAGINCLTAQMVNEQRIVICRGAQQTSFTLNVCIVGSACSQIPITLESCPIIPGTGSGTQQAATPVNVVPTEILPTVSPTFQSSLSTPTPIATQAGPVRSPFTATAPAPFQPLGTPSVTALPPATGLQDPEGFIRWYFETVWKQRNYQDLWDNYLTPSYKANVGSGDFADYVGWWNSVERVEIQSVSVLQNNAGQAMIRVYAAFYMRDGRVVASQPYDYDLLYDASRGTWMFDYRI